LELRILKTLEEKTRRERTCGAEAPRLQRPGEEMGRKRKLGEEEMDWTVFDESMQHAIIVSDNCQGLLFKKYHSN
jgi:hypothetical protein